MKHLKTSLLLLIVTVAAFSAGRTTAPTKIQTEVVHKTVVLNDSGRTVRISSQLIEGQLGRQETVDKNQWVTVKNPNGIESSNNFFPFNELGLAERGGTITIIDVIEDTYLVRYKGPKDRERGGGTTLPTGAIFFLPKKDVDGMTERHETRKLAERREREHIIALGHH